jgi:hypothetical protein
MPGTMRREYRLMSDTEQASLDRIKELGDSFHDCLVEIESAALEADNATGTYRELDIAKARIEEAVMWAVKFITR